MFDWLSLFKKNTDKNVCNNSEIIYSDEAKFLIDKWMKLNGIEGISFDEYIKQLGLDYIDIINLEATNLNLSSPIWKDENFIGVLSFKSESILSGYDERFDLDGKCIKGPANYDISYKEISSAMGATERRDGQYTYQSIRVVIEGAIVFDKESYNIDFYYVLVDDDNERNIGLSEILIRDTDKSIMYDFFEEQPAY